LKLTQLPSSEGGEEEIQEEEIQEEAVEELLQDSMEGLSSQYLLPCSQSQSDERGDSIFYSE